MNSNGRRMTREQAAEISKTIDEKIGNLLNIVNAAIDRQRTQERIVMSDDCAQPITEREREGVLNVARMRQLKELREAQRRMKLGVYGICLNCEEPIGFKRLKAVPAALHCVSCADGAGRPHLTSI